MFSSRWSRIVGFALVFALFFLSSCIGLKSGGANSAQRLFETFFVGEDGTQYFIKPLEYKNADKDKLFIDYTFRYKNAVKDSVTMNFSVYFDFIIKNFEEFELVSDNYSLKTDKVDFMFTEKQKKEFHSRFSVKMPFSQVLKIFKDETFKIKVSNQNTSYTFYPVRKTEKAMEEMNEKLFLIF